MKSTPHKLSAILALMLGINFSAFAETCYDIALSTNEKNANTVLNSIPGRVQWNHNNGYCGSVSIISAGLYYGQYVSQFDARALANIDFSSKKLQNNQILIGYFKSKNQTNNMTNALTHLHLNFKEFNNLNPKKTTSKEFLVWVKNYVALKRPVIIGVYENVSIFSDANDQEYDHIVPVFGIASKHSLKEKPVNYYEDDVIYFRDNGLYTGKTHSDSYCYNNTFDDFQQSRKGANRHNGNIYSLSDNSNKHGNFGIAVTGVKSTGAILMPIRIETNPVIEYPEIKEGSNQRPSASKTLLTIYVSQLKKENRYILLKYTNFDDLPSNDDFGQSDGKPAKKCSIFLTLGDTFTLQETILSSETAIYRARKTKDNEAIPPACA